MTNKESMFVRVYFEDFIVNEYFGPYGSVREIEECLQFIDHGLLHYNTTSTVITSKHALNELWEIQSLKSNYHDDDYFEPYTKFPDLLHLDKMGTIGHDFIMDGEQHVYDFHRAVTWEAPFGKCFWLRVAERDDWLIDTIYFGPYMNEEHAEQNNTLISLPHSDPALWNISIISDEFRLFEEALPEDSPKLWTLLD